MAYQFFQSVASMQYIGSPQGAVTALCTPRTSNPNTVPLAIDWNVYWQALNQPSSVAVNVDLGMISPAGGKLDSIRSVKIDNTFSTCPIYVVFEDTRDVVTCPPQTVVTMPVNTNQQNFTVVAQGLTTGFIPFTRLYLFNIELPASVDPAIQYVYPQLLGSPSIQRTGSNILTPGFAAPALGDQIQSLFLLLTGGGPFNVTQTLFGGVKATGVFIITNYNLFVSNLRANASISQPFAFFISNNLGDVLIQHSISAVNNNNGTINVTVANMNAMQVKIDATKEWKLHGTASTGEGLATGAICYTYDPNGGVA